MLKNAYLIIAHKYDYTLKKLLKILDYPTNDIFIHMDKKNDAFDSSEENQIINGLRWAEIDFTQRTKVEWGAIARLILNFSYSIMHAKQGLMITII